jgi:gluconate kinase
VAVEDVLRRQAGCFDVIYLHRPSHTAQYTALARRYYPRARILHSSLAKLHQPPGRLAAAR